MDTMGVVRIVGAGAVVAIERGRIPCFCRRSKGRKTEVLEFSEGVVEDSGVITCGFVVGRIIETTERLRKLV